MICRISNQQFPPQSTKMNTFTIRDITFLMTRFSNHAMQKVYGSMLLPLISTKHTHLIFRLFEMSHIKFNPSHEHNLGVFHVPATSSLVNMRSDVCASICVQQRKIIGNLIENCAHCIRFGQSSRPYSHHPEDNRLVEFIGAESVSIDFLSEIQVKAHARARGQLNHTVSVLIACDLASGRRWDLLCHCSRQPDDERDQGSEDNRNQV